MNSIVNEFKEVACRWCRDTWLDSSIKVHEESCDAQYSESHCEFCGTLVLLCDREEHINNCPILTSAYFEQTVHCEFCNEQVIQLYMNDHYADCPQKEIIQFYQEKKSKVEECPICLENLLPTDIKGELACFHLFHKPCLDDWFKKSQICPVCRYGSD